MNQTNKIVVVLSPGRSGSSLLMKIMGSFGMNLSKDMIPASYGNPEGFYENKEIVDIHKDLLRNICADPKLPLPEGWLDSEPAKKAKILIKNVLKKNLSSKTSIWGFKDPRTAIILPLWNLIFNQPGLLPKYLIAVRDPSSVIISLKRQINLDSSVAELLWLHRITEALYHTAGDCFIVHYEDWFINPIDIVQNLIAYTDLNETSDNEIRHKVGQILAPQLNRSVIDTYEIKNSFVRILYDELKNCRYTKFDKKKLLTLVKECRDVMGQFEGWSKIANYHFGEEIRSKQGLKEKTQIIDKMKKKNKEIYDEKLSQKTNKIINKSNIVGSEIGKKSNMVSVSKSERQELERKMQAKIQMIEAELKRVVFHNSQLMNENKEYFDRLEECRKRLSSSQTLYSNKAYYAGSKNEAMTSHLPSTSHIKREMQKVKKEAIILRHSTSYKLGQILIYAIGKPGKNTVMMPYNLFRLCFDVVSGRKKRSLNKALKSI